MANYLRHIILFVLFFLLSTHLHAQDSCVSPTDNIVLNNTLKDQNIDKPFVVGLSGGEALYYKIELAVEGRLVINTATDTSNPSDKVDTYGRLLNSDCSNLDINDIELSTNPRYFKFDKLLPAGTYFLRVHNKVTLDDSSSEFAKGYFQIDNSFTPTAPQHKISITKSSVSTISSGDEIIYTIDVINEGTDATTSVKVSDPLPSPNHLSFVRVDASTTGWSCVDGNPLECTLDGGVINYNETKRLKLVYRADYQTYDRSVSNTTFVDVDYSASTLHKDGTPRDVTILKETPSIDLSKSAYQTGTNNTITQVVEGGEFEYSLFVENSGTLVDENITISDTIDNSFSITALSPECSASGQNVTCNLSNLSSGATKEVRIRVKALTVGSNIQNSATVTADTILGSINDSDAKSIDVVAQNPLVTITKTRSEANIIVGHPEFYVISVKNSGNIPLTNLHVTDDVPSELELTNASGDGWDCTASDTATNRADCTFVSLNSGETKYLRIDIKGKTVADNVINTAHVITTEGVSNSDDETLNVIAPQTGIHIQKRVSSSTVNSLDTFNYTLSVDNNGSEDDSDIVVTDSIDAQFTLPSDWNQNSAPWSCSNSGNDITCSYTGTLSPNASATDIIIKVQAPYTASDIVIDNTAVVNAKSGSPQTAVSDSDTVAVTITSPTVGFFLTKTSSKSSVVSGDSYTYTISVDNNGTIDEEDIVIKDTIDEFLDGNFTINQGNFDCSASVGRDINCKLATLDASAHEEFTISITAPIVEASTVVSNRADATAKVVHTSETRTGSDSVAVTINPVSSSLSITKNSSKNIILENDTFSYLISVKNNSIASEHNLTVTDDIDSNLKILSHTGFGWSCSHSGQLISCNLNTLEAGKHAGDINITVQAPAKINADKTIANIAKVVSSKEITGKTAQKDVKLVKPDNALMIHMTSNPDRVYTNDTYYYKIFITNNSAKSISHVELNETLPTELQYDYYESGGWSCDYDSSSRVFSCDNNGTQFTAGEKVIKLYVQAPNYEANVTNSLSLTSDLDPYIREANATTEVIGKSANLIFSKSYSDKTTVKVGEDFTYTLQVKNDGVAPDSDINATNIKIAFDLDQNVTYQSHSTTGWSCSFSAPTLTCTLPFLELGEYSQDINVTVSAVSESQSKSIAKLTADQMKVAVETPISVDIFDVIDLDMSLELSDSLDPVEADSPYYYEVVVKNLDPLKNAKNVVVDINTTSVDDYLLTGYVGMVDWDCSKSAKLLTCSLKHDLLADTNETLKVEVQAPNKVTTVELNATLSSIYVNDTNLANNSVYEDTSIIVTDLTAHNPRDFTKVPLQGQVDLNIYGDLLTIGNQSICEKDSSGNCQEPSYVVNDYVTQEYVNLDSAYAGSYKTATSAKLEIDASDEIVWAGLYWMGRIDKSISGYQTKMEDAHKVYLRADSNTSGYIEVQAQRSADAIDNSGATITVDKFNYINGDTYFDYQGVADVTSYVKANRGGDYWVGDIQSSEGDNLSAGWNLVVIVRDTKLLPTRELKNITVFDGFQGVWKTPDGVTTTLYEQEVNQTVKGFLTPTTGPIKSTLIFFGFEGDRTLSDFIKVSDSTGIMHALTNVKNPADDVVNGTITQDGVTVISRDPNLDNTSGIDVDEFYLGDIADVMGTGIIDNGQTEANISIGSLGVAANNNGGDRFFLGMFGFSTNLNDPMCYMQTLKNAEFTADLGTTAQLGEEIGIEVEFRNIEVQTLENMHSYSQINKIFKEDNSSFELKNIAEGSFTAQNSLFEFNKVDVGDDNLTEVTTSVGLGASSSVGGSVKTGESVYIRFNAILDDSSDDNLTNNIYSVSYNPNPTKKIQISRCSGDNQKLSIIPNITNGFELTHKDGIPTGYSGDISSLTHHRHLYTQVQDKAFMIDVVALNDTVEDKVADSYRGLVRVELVDMSDFDGTVDGCKNLTTLGIKRYAQFDGDVRKSVDINSDNAYNNVGFRLSYLVDKYNRHIWRDTALSLAGDNNLTKVKQMLDSKPYGTDDRCSVECSGTDENLCLECVYKSKEEGGLANFSCSADRFVIKPKEISLSVPTSPMVGGKSYNLLLDANSTGYDTNVTLGSDGALDYNLSTPPSCDRTSLSNVNSSLINGTTIEFIDGNATVSNFTYPNVGDINVSFVDSGWTALDQNLSDTTMSDCIVGSSSNTPVGGKVGCNIANSSIFSFAPARFKNSIVDFKPFRNGFTYISNKKSMSAPLKFKISAILDDNTTVATNFHSGCFATDVNYTIAVNGLSDARYFDLNSSIMNSDETTGEFTSREGNFTNGVATVTVGLNAKREIKHPKNPFMINGKDLNITVDDNGTYNISGVGFGTVVDQNISFYYGRLNIPDIETAKDNIAVTAYYEVYCKNCNKLDFPLAKGSESGDSIFWYINNSNHTSPLQGTYTTLSSENGTTCATSSYSGFNASLGSLKPPHHDRISFKPSSWLIYNKFKANAVSDSFNITFFSTSNRWAGKGDRGMTMDQNISKRNAKKLDW